MISLAEFLTPIEISLRVASISSAAVFLLGICAAWLMNGNVFIGKSVLETAFMLPLVLPPSVIGFILLVALGRKGWLGAWMEAWFQQSLLFTWWSAVIASVVVAFPLVYQTLKVGFASIDREIVEAARSQGAGEWQILRWIVLPLSVRALISAWILGFARGLGEFGATMMVAGNIPGRTQTVPTAIYSAVDSGNMTLAWAWSAALVLLSFFMLWITGRRKVR